MMKTRMALVVDNDTQEIAEIVQRAKLSRKLARDAEAYRLGHETGITGANDLAMYDCAPPFQSNAWVAGYQAGLWLALKNGTVTQERFEDLYEGSGF